MTRLDTVLYRNAREEDADVLPRIARGIFVDTFADKFDAEVLMAFCETAYGRAGSMRRDLADPAITWRVAETAGQPIAYAKLRPWRSAAADSAEPSAIELQQIYVQAAWHGQGVAEALMQWAVATAQARGATALYLTVFDHNTRAKRFYTRHGFTEVGHIDFVMGGQVHDDRIWRRPL